LTSSRLTPPRLVPRDLEILERRARELVSGDGQADDRAGAERLVLFRVLGLPCAVPAAPVERALSRLLGATPVPTADGRDRIVAFVEEQPLPVADLAGAASGAERPAAELSGAPALVLTTPEGPVAVAVEGPLDLREDRLAGAAQAADERAAAGLRLAGRLADGTSVLDAAWLLAWAARVARQGGGSAAGAP
jgi:hypothetical protein